MALEDIIRSTRNEKLAASDIEIVKLLEAASSWADFNSKRSAMVSYRTALRDLPSDFPEDMDVETMPAMPLSPSQQAALDSMTEE